MEFLLFRSSLNERLGVIWMNVIKCPGHNCRGARVGFVISCLLVGFKISWWRVEKREQLSRWHGGARRARGRRWVGSLETEPHLSFCRGQKRIEVFPPFGLPTLLGPLRRLPHQLVAELLLGTLRQVANFDCFCGRNFVNWNPCVWKPENKIYHNNARLQTKKKGELKETFDCFCKLWPGEFMEFKHKSIH